MIGVLFAGFAGLGDQDHQSAMYLPALAAHPGMRPVAVCSSGAADRAAAERAAATVDIPVLPGLADALAEPGIDLVSVAVPLDQRADAITACLRAGKHVLADKPLAVTSAQVEQILAVATETGKILLPAHHLRWHPALRTAQAAIAKGRVGLPWNVQADFLVAGGVPVPDGELLNFAVYPVDVLRFMLRLDALRVQAYGGRYWHDGADDFATLLIDYPHGVTATITVGRAGELRDVRPGGVVRDRYRISGSQGTFVTDALRPALDVHTGATRRASWVGGNTVARMVADLGRACASTTDSPIGAADVLDTYRIIDAARRSLATGHPSPIEGAAA